MTLDEKLDNFYTSVIDDATKQNHQVIEEYKDSLQKMYEERKQAALLKAENNYRITSDHIIREKNRKLSSGIMEIKRDVLEKTTEYTDIIFQEVEEKLKEFMQTSSYEEFLINKIKEANSFSRNDVITFYINPSDEKLKASLEEKTGIKLTISDRDFFGGIRAVISSRSILIDHSFLTKLTEAKNSFQF